MSALTSTLTGCLKRFFVGILEDRLPDDTDRNSLRALKVEIPNTRSCQDMQAIVDAEAQHELRAVQNGVVDQKLGLLLLHIKLVLVETEIRGNYCGNTEDLDEQRDELLRYIDHVRAHRRCIEGQHELQIGQDQTMYQSLQLLLAKIKRILEEYKRRGNAWQTTEDLAEQTAKLLMDAKNLRNYGDAVHAIVVAGTKQARRELDLRSDLWDIIEFLLDPKTKLQRIVNDWKTCRHDIEEPYQKQMATFWRNQDQMETGRANLRLALEQNKSKE
ncbi:hypothetical protein EDC01DRAFT_781492 [Geopyxis carbonaria]|nr:hypothetical protein EDC01DRAFT_781492 [Geopyxis carbonaria]